MPLLSLSLEWTEPAITSLWHILYEYFEFHLQNQQLMCMLLCVGGYICICVFMFFRITQSFDTVQVWILPDEGLVCQIASGEQFDLVLPWGDLICAGSTVVARDGPQEAPEPWQKKRKKCQRSHSGREELQVIPRSHGVWGRNVKRPVSSEPISVRAEALLAVTPLYSSSFSGINESASVLPLLLPGIIQGLSNQAHSFIFFCVPFCKSFPWITA